MARRVAPPEQPNYIHRSALAAMLDMTERALDEHAKVGHVVRAPQQAYFLFPDSVTAYVKHLKGIAAQHESGGYSVVVEGALVKKAQRERIELELAEKRGHLVSAEGMIDVFSTLVVDTRTAILSIPARIKAELPHMVASEVEKMKAVVRETLAELKALGEKPPRIEA